MKHFAAALLASTALALPATAASLTTRADSAKAAVGTSGCGIYAFSGVNGFGCFDAAGANPGAVPIAPVEAPWALPLVGGTMSGSLLFGNTPLTSPIDLYDNPPSSQVSMTPGGAGLSIAPIGGHAKQFDSGVASGDSFRAEHYDFMTSLGYGPSKEITTYIAEMSSQDGYTPYWAASTSYPTGTYIAGGDGAIFKQVATSTCTSGTNTAPTTPSNAQNIANGSAGPAYQTDGSCSWQYIGVGAGNNRSAILATTDIGVNGGSGWGMSIVTDVAPGAWMYNGAANGGFNPGLEIDNGNRTHDCAPGTTNGCQIIGAFINGNGTYASTIGVWVGGSQGYHIGYYVTNAKDIAFYDGSAATTGIRLAGTKNVGVDLQYLTSSYYQILGKGFNVDPTGITTATSIISQNLYAPAKGPLNLGNASDGFGLVVADSGGSAAANRVTINGALQSTGSDTNVGLNLAAQGTGSVQMLSPLALTKGVAGQNFSVDINGVETIVSLVSSNLYAPAKGPLNLGNAGDGFGLVVADSGGSAAVNRVTVNGAPTGYGPTLQATGSDTNVPLNINAQGTSAVAIRSPVVAPNLATSGGTVKGTLCADTSGNVYVKTTTGACL